MDKSRCGWWLGRPTVSTSCSIQFKCKASVCARPCNPRCLKLSGPSVRVRDAEHRMRTKQINYAYECSQSQQCRSVDRYTHPRMLMSNSVVSDLFAANSSVQIRCLVSWTRQVGCKLRRCVCTKLTGLRSLNSASGDPWRIVWGPNLSISKTKGKGPNLSQYFVPVSILYKKKKSL